MNATAAPQLVLRLGEEGAADPPGIAEAKRLAGQRSIKSQVRTRGNPRLRAPQPGTSLTRGSNPRPSAWQADPERTLLIAYPCISAISVPWRRRLSPGSSFFAGVLAPIRHRDAGQQTSRAPGPLLRSMEGSREGRAAPFP